MDSDVENGDNVPLPDRVRSFWENSRPLSEKEKIARWMGAQLADDWQVHHEEVVEHIKTTYGLDTDHLSSTDDGGPSIDDDILNRFKEPVTIHGVEWHYDPDYSKRRWELYQTVAPFSEMEVND